MKLYKERNYLNLQPLELIIIIDQSRVAILTFNVFLQAFSYEHLFMLPAFCLIKKTDAFHPKYIV
jgi:hypothetical protein